LEFLNKYIAPWVLPNQAIPIHCVWVPEMNLKKIEILIPKDYRISDTLNFSEYNYDETKNTISISVNNLKSDNYFGIVLTYSNICEDVEKRDEVTIRFLDVENNMIATLTFCTRIVRPKLAFLQFPKEIVVTDQTNPKDLINLEILHKGFGTANLNINVMHSDENIALVDSLFADVVTDVSKRILTSSRGEGIEGLADYAVDETLLREIAEVILSQSAKEELPIELDERQKKELVEILKDETRREVIYRIVYSSLRSLVLSAIVYYAERHPEEDIKLLYGRMAADLTKRIDELTIRINYHDSIQNEYPPIEAKIRVMDQRTFKKQPERFEAPINIIWKKDLLDLED